MSGALSYLDSTLSRGSRLGLERTRELLERMGNPQDQLKFVHVTGTNGKGSIAAMTASVLTASGCRTGLYTSPCLRRLHERIRVDGHPISDAALEEVTAFARLHADRMADPPTEFELVTAIAFAYFHRQKCGLVVLEVGMGGLRDSTNVIGAPEVAVIARIGLDHTKELGDTVEKIAAEKGGIIKLGCAVALYGGQPEAGAVIAGICASCGALLREVDFSALHPLENTLDGQTFAFGAHKDLRIPLLGRHQLQNAATAVTVIDLLRERGWKISAQALRAGLQKTVWPARFELVQRQPAVLLDGGHNPQGVQTLVDGLQVYFPGKKITFVVGLLADKDYAAMLALAAPLAARFYAVEPSNPRALPAGELAAVLERYGLPVRACPSVKDGLREALEQLPPDGVLCNFGSLYMMGEAREFFGLE